ncbi:hypothetical protein C2E21_9514 [Chlorella sorokiniana]|uniref:Uncharacterized protein n=1 Tax=Chlorella sorokiniana TaxID=3076 RepID=A0A2P6TB44_CHLSO|nr:hypothetical protein C2E21_9514 [Chlorella sorokiniana]|eukprot:PRW05762.1 hypothetical protein C2E21_9514 [Chlorella sorokiniana]
MNQPETRAQVDADTKYAGVPVERPEPGPQPDPAQKGLMARWHCLSMLQMLWDEREQRRAAADEAARMAAEVAAADALAGLAEGPQQGARPGPVVHLASQDLLKGAPGLASILLEKSMLPWVHTAAGGEAAVHEHVDEEHPLLLRPHTYPYRDRRGNPSTIVVPREASGPHHGATQYPFWFAACQFFQYLLKGSPFYEGGTTKTADVVYFMMVALMTKAGLWDPFRRWVRHVGRGDAVPVFPFERERADPMNKAKTWAWVFNGQALPPRQDVGPPLSAAEKEDLVRSLWGWVELPAESEAEDEEEWQAGDAEAGMEE